MNGKKQILIFIGPPGCGKGSLSYLCVKQLGWQQLSTGNLCRQHITNNTEIGKKIDFNMKSGKLISDELIISMVEEWLSENFAQEQGIILDGFPRTAAQAVALHESLSKPEFFEMKLNLVKISVSDASIINRLAQRAICQNNKCQSVYSLDKISSLRPRVEMVCDNCSGNLVRRLDDAVQAINERLRFYHKHEQELLDFFMKKNMNINIVEGEDSLDNVYKQLLNILGIKDS